MALLATPGNESALSISFGFAAIKAACTARTLLMNAAE
jgi:hypothetical protein